MIPVLVEVVAVLGIATFYGWHLVSRLRAEVAGLRTDTTEAAPVAADRPGDAGHLRRAEIARLLPGAAERGELYVTYQPIHRSSDRRLSGLEALLRWEHPRHGSLPPAEFIPVAEETGSIVEIGEWVLREACRDLAALASCGHDLVMSVNVSVHQLHAPGFPAIVESVLESSGVRAESLQLELTESALARPEDVGTTLDRIRALGVRVALDDVGAGYSSLVQLAALPIDTIKIDRSLTATLGRSSAAAEQVFASLVALGQSLALDVVTEGIETETQSQVARAVGSTYEQGYLYARPERLDRVLDYARQSGTVGAPD